jgi:hypothetical protein
MPAAVLPERTKLNTNGAGDAYTSGLLLASMLRHTGQIVPSLGTKTTESRPEPLGSKKDLPANTKKMTPYTLYMRENYVTLKQQCKNDKKAIFTMCHEMWENESEEVKAMYSRMVKEEYEDAGGGTNEMNTSAFSESSMDDALDNNMSNEYSGVIFQMEQAANTSLNLESAVQFAGLVAAHHVDMNTRDLDHIDLDELLQQSIISLSPIATSEI